MSATRIRFQNVWEIRQFGLLTPILQAALEVGLEVWPADTCDINELHRHPFDPNWKKSSPHCGWTKYIRAIDIRIIGIPPVDKVVDRINDFFLYDPERSHLMVAHVHDPPHLHLQVHDRTTRKR